VAAASGLVALVDFGLIFLAALTLDAFGFATFVTAFLVLAAKTMGTLRMLSTPGVGLVVQTQTPPLIIQAWPLGALL
jgi:hypothetical protein